MKFYRARYESTNFEFEGFAHTKEQAVATLKRGLKLHTKQYDLEKDWYTPDDINVDAFEFGVPYRDYETIEDE